MQHKTYILSLSKHSQIKVYAIIVINRILPIKIGEGSYRGGPPCSTPCRIPPLNKGFFGVCRGGSMPRPEDFSGFFGKTRVF